MLISSVDAFILSLKALMPVHLGIDENVCINVARIMEGWKGPLLCLSTDGDLLACIAGMVRCRSSALL